MKGLTCMVVQLLVQGMIFSLLSLLKLNFFIPSPHDMIRYPKFTVGYALIPEYGNPDEEVHFKNLIKYVNFKFEIMKSCCMNFLFVF